MSNLPYIHGYSQHEQQRLYRQARFAENLIYQGIDLSQQGNLVEIGSGVGAQTEILLRRFPSLHVTSVECSQRQISAAKQHLAALHIAAHRYRIEEMNAAAMSFPDQSFDAGFICWVLEHMKEHLTVLKETRRVLRKGAPLIVTEVMNSSFFLDPYSPAIWQYWMAFNDYQYDNYGDPFVGAKLGNLLQAAGFKNISTTIKYWHLDNRSPKIRTQAISMWKELLLSAEQILVEKKLVTTSLVEQMKREFAAVESNPQAVFFDAFVQAQAVR